MQKQKENLGALLFGTTMQSFSAEEGAKIQQALETFTNALTRISAFQKSIQSEVQGLATKLPVPDMKPTEAFAAKAEIALTQATEKQQEVALEQLFPGTEAAAPTT